ncbi:hypothetical protein NKH77_07885 [Streptomyces sp. M19]
MSGGLRVPAPRAGATLTAQRPTHSKESGYVAFRSPSDRHPADRGLLLAGCSGHHHSSDAKDTTPRPSARPRHRRTVLRRAGRGDPDGPGPQGHYTVRKQPAAGSCHYRAAGEQPLPDARCTPGALNPKVTQATLRTTVCRGGYTSSIRPPVSVTAREKKSNAASYHYTHSLRDAEYDHLVSLELGGDPNDPRNLWVEPPSPATGPERAPTTPRTRWSRSCTPPCARGASASPRDSGPSPPTGPRP